MIQDPLFYALAVVAVILIGLSKGGFGGALALLGVPIVALAIPPVQAAAIFLPILIVMDMAALYSWHGIFDRRTLRAMLPAAVLGIAAGWATAAYVNDNQIRLIVGILALAFVAQWWLGGREAGKPKAHRPWQARLWGAVAGYTSFVSHAGGPPFQMYTLPLKLDRRVYAGTGAVFFALVNAIKVVPYMALGQFTTGNLMTSAVLLPLAPLATLAGAWAVTRVNQELFYRITYAALVPVGIKLIWDGLTG
jgi:uncharacterized membrane protein YfcA